ncbi:unnamed protein product [Protopolystoma xenopodis]|uniref:Uncharacterized protein n=1 Tax=Protopolystoma xenopodis TaxID=117903 RepID=A0A3S5C3A2_9PLAT|nr:unnamed protein product [Protopolystoma xenopodis]
MTLPDPRNCEVMIKLSAIADDLGSTHLGGWVVEIRARSEIESTWTDEHQRCLKRRFWSDDAYHNFEEHHSMPIK